MKMRIEIKLLQLPWVGYGFGFTVKVNDVLLLDVAKTYGASGSAGVIARGFTTNNAAAATVANLQAYNGASGVVYSLAPSGTSVYIDIDAAGTILVQDVSGKSGYVHVYVQDPEIMGMAPFNEYNLSIEIFDTYENERPLIEEFTQVSAPKIMWDGGDDLYQAYMASNLTFNMAVPDAADGKFLHLLTGDEKRYLVKVRNTDTHDAATLLWQGYLLPDLYSEPWKNGVPFISFTAIDMLASLKGKTFDPWVYRQKMQLPELFGMILAETGLLQEMYVSPCLVNVSHGENYQWRDINIDMNQFVNGKKYTYLYELLESVLAIQGLQLFSFRGKWFFEGLTRRSGMSLSGGFPGTKPVTEVYHPDGIFKENVFLSRHKKAPDYSEDLPVITAETPWKKVNMNVNTDTEEGLFPEGIVYEDYHSTRYRYDSDFHDYTNGYVNKFQADWKKVGAPLIDWGNGSRPFFNYSSNKFNEYSVNEASALMNYFECLVTPYAVAGRRYKLEMDITIECSSPLSIIGPMNGGAYDSLVVWQLLIDNVEFLTNRPGNKVNKILQFTKTIGPEIEDIKSMQFKLTYEFVMPQSGYFKFRFLSPIIDMSDLSLAYFNILPKVMKIALAKDADSIENVVAARDIAYTRELDIDLDTTCSVDSSVRNSLGIGSRTGDRYISVPSAITAQFYDTHYKSIDYDVFNPIANEWEVSYTVAAYLELCEWPINSWLQELIFRQEQNVALFLTKADGSKVPFNSVYCKTVLGQAYLAAYNGYITPTMTFGEPNLPEDYKPVPVPGEGDILTLMASIFGAEDLGKRALWKIYGFPDNTADSYLKTLGKACHSVRPQTGFSIDAAALSLVWPLQRLLFRYMGEDKYFIPVRTELDLSASKTTVTMKEAMLENVTDISYE